jgi:nucleoside-diphosphate-sugar epimerase
MKKLVIGASGFVGSHVVRRLVADGEDVRVMLRKTSSTKGIDDLAVERCYGDLFDDDALRAAMAGCDVVYYCVVDARMWLRDPAPLFRTNVEGLRHVLDVAVEAGLSRFVFTSTAGTMAISEGTPVTEEDPHNWDDGGPYIEARVAAEDLVLRYARERGLPAVAMCISTTYGPGDWAPTPHGGLIARVAAGRFPFYLGSRRRWWGSRMRLGPWSWRANTAGWGSATSSPTAISAPRRCIGSLPRPSVSARPASACRWRFCSPRRVSTIWRLECCGAICRSRGRG